MALSFYPSEDGALPESVVAPALVGLLGGVDPLEEGSTKSYRANFNRGLTLVTFEVVGRMGDLGYAVADEFEVGYLLYSITPSPLPTPAPTPAPTPYFFWLLRPCLAYS